MILLFFYIILPTAITLLLFSGYCFFRRDILWTLCGLFGTLSLAFTLYMIVSGGPYIWALYLEGKWTKNNPKTQIEMESNLSLYRRYDIDPSISDWGGGHKLEEGDRMTRYMILWESPLDVVYTKDNEIVAIYTSYE